jgi:hypothetical protein
MMSENASSWAVDISQASILYSNENIQVQRPIPEVLRGLKRTASWRRLWNLVYCKPLY